MGLPKTLLFGPDEFKDLKNLISKKSTSSWGGRRKPPRAFTEFGLYMLMTEYRKAKQRIDMFEDWVAMFRYFWKWSCWLKKDNKR